MYKPFNTLLLILLGGANPSTAVYTVTYNNISLSAINGFRLEVLEHDSLPLNGRGRSSNGNFVLTELKVSATAIPELTTIALLGIGLPGLAGAAVRQRFKKKQLKKVRVSSY